MIEVSDSWTMSWDDEGEDAAGEPQELVLLPGMMLVAEVRGEYDPGRGLARTNTLCVGSRGETCVRDGEGRLLWARSLGAHRVEEFAAGRLLGPDEALPSDHAAETRAVIDALHLLDWLCPQRYLVDPGEVWGDSQNLGPFRARLDPTSGFVISVQVGVGGSRRTVVEVLRWVVVDIDARFLSPRTGPAYAPADLERLLSSSR